LSSYADRWANTRNQQQLSSIFNISMTNNVFLVKQNTSKKKKKNACQTL
jgi:hypothetical protein